MLRRFHSDALRAAVAIVVSSLLACDATSGQGGVDAQSRKARADSVRRALRAAQAKAPATTPAAAAPGATPKTAVASAAGAAATAPEVAAKRPAKASSAAAAPAVGVARTPAAGKVARTPARTTGTAGAASTTAAPARGGSPASASAPAATSVPATSAPPSAAPTAAPAPAVAPPVAPPAPASPAPAAPTVATPTAPARSTSASLPRRNYTTRELDSIRTRWQVEEPVVWVASPLARRVSPGLGFATPSGYGPAWGDFFMSVSYQQRTRFTTKADGAVGVGMGLGDPVQYLGGELVYSSFGTVNRGFFSNGTVSARVHRIIRGYGVSVGLENVVDVGRQTSGGPDGGRSAFIAVSQLRRLGVTDTITTTEPTDGQELIWTIGLGDGRFRREPDVAARKSTVNLFGSVGYRFAQRFAGIVDYTGQDVTMALSAAPFRCIPLVITPGFADITGSAGDGARFVLAIGLSTRFDQDAFFRRPCSR